MPMNTKHSKKNLAMAEQRLYFTEKDPSKHAEWWMEVAEYYEKIDNETMAAKAMRHAEQYSKT